MLGMPSPHHHLAWVVSSDLASNADDPCQQDTDSENDRKSRAYCLCHFRHLALLGMSREHSRLFSLACLYSGCDTPRVKRSEEHTSELQSPCNLVCRLLLEKKKKVFAEHRLPVVVSTQPLTRHR